jgi:hypothetical protein
MRSMAGHGDGKGHSGGRNAGGQGRVGCGTGRSSTTTTKTAKKGLCMELEGNVFDIGQQLERNSSNMWAQNMEKILLMSLRLIN